MFLIVADGGDMAKVESRLANCITSLLSNPNSYCVLCSSGVVVAWGYDRDAISSMPYLDECILIWTFSRCGVRWLRGFIQAC